MKKYLHPAPGLCKTRGAADVARQRRLDQGLPDSQPTMLQPGREARVIPGEPLPGADR